MAKLIFLVLLTLSALTTTRPLAADDTADPEFCVALRGNGYKVPVTLAALARLTEEFGVADIVLGTSSGSIAAFLYENILLNPAIQRCGNGTCPPEVLARRVSLALKSMLGFGSYLRATPSGRIVDRTAAKLAGKHGPGAAEVWAVLTDPPLRRMLNAHALFPSWALANPLNWGAHASRLRRSAQATNFGSSVDFELLVREGLLDLDYTVQLIGRVGDFYSNSGPDLTTQWQRFFEHCTGTQINTGWPSIAQRSLPDGQTCGTAMEQLIADFNARAYPSARRIEHRGSRRVPVRHRYIDPLSLERTVGQTHPTLMTVSFVIGDDTMREFADAKQRYARFRPVDLQPRDWLDQFRIGYFGPERLLAQLARNPAGFDDVKTRRFIAAGQERWGETMVRSIGEPGLQAGRVYRAPTGQSGFTAGGWVDNFGTQPLKNLGCRSVAYVTRRGTDSNFAAAVARQLGADDEFVDRLFSATPDGAFGDALDKADAIVCTDWDSFTGPLNSPLEMAAHGYQSPLVTRDDWFIERASESYPIERAYDFDGCHPP